MSQNDSGKIGFIIFIFLASAAVIPLVQESLNDQSKIFNEEGYAVDILDESTELSLSPTSFFGVFTNTVKLALIGFSGLPFWLDLFYTTLAILFLLLLSKYIPGIGSGG